jgi:hypothetical protein
MYHHFVLEVLPRILLLLPHIDSNTKILTFGSPYEQKWLTELGIQPHQTVIYDPTVEYCADELLVPSSSPAITPPKENYDMVGFYSEMSLIAFLTAIITLTLPSSLLLCSPFSCAPISKLRLLLLSKKGVTSLSTAQGVVPVTAVWQMKKASLQPSSSSYLHQNFMFIQGRSLSRKLLSFSSRHL